MSEFWKRKRRDGKPGAVWWTNLHGRRVSTGCEDRRAAEVWRRAREREGADPRHAASQKASLGDAVRALYAELRRRGRSEAYQSKIRGKIGHFVTKWGEDMPLARINVLLVEKYIDDRLDEPSHPKGTAKVKGFV